MNMEPYRGTAPHTLDQVTTVLACTRLVHDFAWCSDNRRFEDLATLFTEDGSFARPRTPDHVIYGRHAILAAFQSRPTDEITRHCIGNLRIDVESAERALGHFYLVLYGASRDPQAGAFGARTDGRQLIAEVDDEYALTSEGWRIAARRGRIIMHT